MIMKWKEKILPIVAFDRMVRRLVASWFAMAIVVLCFRKNDFSDTSFLKDMTWDLPIVVFIGFFILISALAAVLPTKRTDSFAMLFALVSLTSVWMARLDMTDEEKWLFCFVLAGVFALVLWDFVSQNEDILTKLRLPRAVSPWMAVLCGVLCAAVIAVTTCLRYLDFASPTYDFGIFIQMFHNMAESLEPLTTCERDEVLSHFAVHLSPIYYVLLPFYWLFPSALTLQIGQAVVVASGIIPFYLLMRKWNFSSASRVAFSALYLLYPIMSKGCFFDLHENCFLFTLLLWLFWAYETEKLPLLALFTVMTCLVKEDSAVYVTIFAIYCLLSGKTKKRKLMGLGMAVYAVAYFIFAVWYINTFGTGIMSGRYDNLSADGSLAGVIFAAFANPGFFFSEILARGWESVQYILALTVPLAFLPFATGKSARWFLLVPMLLNLLTAYPYQLGLQYQYHFGIAAFLLYAALLNWKELRGKVRVYLPCLALAASFVFYSFLILPYVCGRIYTHQTNHEDFAVMEATLDAIPEDASVTASTFILPHLCDRFYAYDADYHHAADTDFVILDIRSAYAANAKKMAERCMEANYTKLIETTHFAIYVSPDWQGDRDALKDDIRAVAKVVYESRSEEEMLAEIRDVLAVLPKDTAIMSQASLISYFPADKTVYDITISKIWDAELLVLDMRRGETDEIASLVRQYTECGFSPIWIGDTLAIYESPIWEGDYLALLEALQELGVLNENG